MFRRLSFDFDGLLLGAERHRLPFDLGASDSSFPRLGSHCQRPGDPDASPAALVVRSSLFNHLMNELLSQLPALLPLAVKWVEDQEAVILRDGARLTGQALADAQAVGVAHSEKIRILYGAAMPVPADPTLLAAGRASGLISPRTGGMAFRYGIFIRHDCRGDRNMVAHECAHTGQYERLGGVAEFLTQYLQQCITIGYPEAPLEQEAIDKAASI